MCLAFLPSPASSLTSRRLSHQPSPLLLSVHADRSCALGPQARGGAGGGTVAAAAVAAPLLFIENPQCQTIHACKRAAKGCLPLAAIVIARRSLAIGGDWAQKVCAYHTEQAWCSAAGTILINNCTLWLCHQHQWCRARDWSWSRCHFLKSLGLVSDWEDSAFLLETEKNPAAALSPSVGDMQHFIPI